MLISDRLAYDVAQILELVLTKNQFNEDQLTVFLLLLLGRSPSNCRQIQKEPNDVNEINDDKIIHFKTLLPPVKAFKFSNPYINTLLFCDYYGQESPFERLLLPGFGVLDIHVEASRYVTDVLLLRPLELARVNGNKPTNLHLLLQRLCQMSQADGEWHETLIYRCKESMEHSIEWFTRVANRLKRIQKHKNTTVINETAKNQREHSGCYWLVAGNCKAEVVEELSLLDVFKIVPLALKTNFSEDAEFLQLLKSIVGSLNIRYRWLRSCGLTPENWLNVKKPSINELKQLAGLREHAAHTVHWQNSQYEQAYQLAFTELKKTAKSIGGFDDFCSWQLSDIGLAMLSRNQHLNISLNALLESGEDDFEPTQGTGNVPEDILTYELHQAIFQDVGDRLVHDPVMKVFISQVLLEHRSVVDKHGLFEESYFKNLVAADEAYSGLNSNELAQTLFYKTRSLIFEVLQETTLLPISTAMQTYIRQVLIEQRPAQGEGGLLNRPSFKKLLAKDDSMNILTPVQIHEQAMNYLSMLLDTH